MDMTMTPLGFGGNMCISDKGPVTKGPTRANGLGRRRKRVEIDNW